jgi:probable HAF family extracellular repeat protein
MKRNLTDAITVITLFATLGGAVRLAAQEQKAIHPGKGEPRHYKLFDLGTLGGPASYFSASGIGAQILNNRGTVAGYGDTSAPDPNGPNNCFDLDCFLAHAFRWRDGVVTDVGALAGVTSSAVSATNEHDWIAGFSQNGIIDPLTGSPEVDAVLWKNHQLINLGTLGGNESLAVGMNNRGQIIGIATNEVPDPFPFPFGLGFQGTQQRAFLWEKGAMQDLGTLGGPDAAPGAAMNERGQVTGASYTSFTPNPASGLPTIDPFLWENGKMIDLGSLGGTSGFGLAVNNRGQVAGQSNLAGDIASHAFLWDGGVLRDLGTLGGTFSTPAWLSDAGDAVGGATTPDDQLFHASLWRDGRITDLGTLKGDCFSEALAINSKSQIVGQSFACDGSTSEAFLWEDDSMVDLNTLIPRNATLQLLLAQNINDLGEIAGVGVPPGSPPNPDLFGHLFLLIPCDGEHSDDEGCEGDVQRQTATVQNGPAPTIRSPIGVMGSGLTAREIAARMGARFGRNHGLVAWPRK